MANEKGKGNDQVPAEISAAGKQLAAYRELHRSTRTCPVCGKEFVGFGRQIYDRPRCRVADFRRKQREEQKTSVHSD